MILEFGLLGVQERGGKWSSSLFKEGLGATMLSLYSGEHQPTPRGGLLRVLHNSTRLQATCAYEDCQ